MATVNIYVDPDATGSATGADWANAYTSLSAAVTAEAEDLTTAGDIHHYHCRASSGSADIQTSTIAFYSAGYRTDGTNRIIIEGDLDSAAYDTTKYRLHTTTNYIDILDFTDVGDVTFLSLQITGDVFGNGSNKVLFNNGASVAYSVVIDGCYIEGTEAYDCSAITLGGWNDTSSGGGTIDVRNTILRGGEHALILQENDATVRFDNCTIVDTYSQAIYDYYTGSNITLTNCLFMGCNDANSLSNINYDYCASDDSTNPIRGVNGVDLTSYTQSQIFEDPTNDDYHINSGLGAGPQLLMAAGTDLSSDFEDDIDGDTRNHWDIGADEVATTTVDIYVDPDATGSADGTDWTDAYTSLLAAVTAEAGDIVSSRNIHHYHCRASSGSADSMAGSTRITLENYTTDDDSYVIIEACGDAITGGEASHGGVLNSDLYRIVHSGVGEGLRGVFNLHTYKCRVRGIQLRVTTLSESVYGFGVYPFVASSDRDIVIERCIVVADSFGQTAFYVRGLGGDTDVKIRNCLSYGPWERALYAGFLDTGASVKVQNCTAYGHSTRGFQIAADEASLTNCIAYDCADDFYDTSTSGGISYCGSSDGLETGTGNVNLSSYTASQIFADPSNDDYHLGSGAGAQALFEAGTDLSTSFTDDIDGDTRTLWDIGADEKTNVTVINIYVDPDASGSEDGTSWTDAYTSLADALDAEATDLTAARAIHHYHCRSSSGTADTFSTDWSSFVYPSSDGYTTDAAHRIIVEGDWDSGVWDTSAYRISSSGVGSYILYLNGVNSTWRNIQFQNTASNQNTITVMLASEADAVFESCLFDGHADVRGIYMTSGFVDDSDSVLMVQNCIFYGHHRHIDVDWSSAYSAAISVLNCTGVGSASNGFFICENGGATDPNLTISNTIAMDSGSTDILIAAGLACENNACDSISSDSGITSGTVDISSYTLAQIFADPANDDYHLASGSPVIGNGTDLSAYFTTDIDGETRSSWDIGADEYSSSGADHELTIADLTGSAHILESPVMSQAQDLAVAELTSTAPAIDEPTLTTEGEDELTVADILARAHVVDEPTIGQAHDLTVLELLGRIPLVDGPTIGSVHDLAVVDLYARTPLIDQPSIGGATGITTGDLDLPRPQIDGAPLEQGHALAAAGLDAGTPTVEQPSLTADTTDELTVGELTAGTPTLAAVDLSEAQALTIADLTVGAPTVDEPTLEQSHDLAADELTTGAPVLDTPAIGQSFSLGVDDLTAGAPTIDQIILTGEGQLAVLDLTSSVPVVDEPTAGQAHALTVGGLTAGAATIDALTLGIRSVLAIAELGTGAPTIDEPDLELGAFTLTAGDLTAGTPVVDTPTVGQAHALALAELAAGAPQIGTVTLNPYANAEILELTGSITRSVAMTAGLTRTISLTATLREDLYG